jgi:hypothetical protein
MRGKVPGCRGPFLFLTAPRGGPPVPGTGSSAILPAVEQRISPNIQPLQAAGNDPAYVPGLMPSRPVEAQDSAPEEAVELPPGDGVPEDTPEEAPEAAPDLAPEEADTSEEEESEDEAEEEVDGPVFEVSDRRGSITADRTGIRFTLDGEEAEFRWNEIGAVEVDTPRFGRRFTVTVYTSTRRWFEADVDAPARSHLKEWTAELDAALDAYFEDTER